jgi:futalosine hydrolase
VPVRDGPSLVLVPTPVELRALAELGGFPGQAVERCGFGPVAAAARAAQLLAHLRPARVWLVGLAGSLVEAELGTARTFTHVRLDGVGAGAGAAFQPASRLGFAQWEQGPERVEETLALAAPPDTAPGEILTVAAASGTPAEAAARRARYPAALAEDMEAFGVALACRLAGMEVRVVRGLSNHAGERDPARWQVHAALAAARALVLAGLAGERA